MKVFMKINTYLFRLAIMIIVIFGGGSILHYFRTGEILLNGIIGVYVGILFLIALLMARKINED